MREPDQHRTVPIRPRAGVFSVFEAVDYKAWFALAEFVDNSIQSWLDAVESGGIDVDVSPLEVAIDLQDGPEGQITVRDNAAGIPLTRFSTAFEVGNPPADPSGLSVYGIGMKSAGAWFARRFEITTTAVGDQITRSVEYDFLSIVREGLDELTFTEESARDRSHGTTILLRELRNPVQTKTHAKIRSHLASIYRNFIRDGQLLLFYQGERLTYDEPEILEAPPATPEGGEPVRWRKEIDFELSSGERVKGFAAIRKVGRTAGSGLSLYRNGRVITGLDDDPWRPVRIFGYGNSYRSQRLFGELHLEGIKVAYSKNGFVWQGTSEEELVERLRSELDDQPLPLLQQAENYRVRGVEPQQRDSASRALGRTAAAVGRAVTADLPGQLERARSTGQGDSDGNQPRPPVSNGQLGVNGDQPSVPAGHTTTSERSLEVTLGGTRWNICIQVDEHSDGDWLRITDTGSPAPGARRDLIIAVNISSRFMRQFGGTDTRDMDAIFRLAAAIALALVVDNERGVPIATILDHINQLLRGNLGR